MRNLGRKTNHIVNWLKRKAVEPSIKFTECYKLNLKEKYKDHHFTIVYFGPEDHDLYTKGHLPYADHDNHLNSSFYHADLSCQKEFGFTGSEPKIVVFRNFD